MPKHNSSAKVVDGSLVLSLPDAVTPVVMRLSLEEVKSAAFTVIEKKDQHVLTVQFSEKETREIAPYDEKEKAVNALMAASAALEKGSRVVGVAMAGNDNASSGMGGSAKGVLKWIGALAAIFVLVYLVTTMSSGLPQAPLPASVTQGDGSNVAANTGAAPFNDPRSVTGQAVSADDFLSRGQ